MSLELKRVEVHSSDQQAHLPPSTPSSKVVLMYNTDDYMLPQLNVGSSGLRAVGGLTREAGLQVSRPIEPRSAIAEASR